MGEGLQQVHIGIHDCEFEGRDIAGQKMISCDLCDDSYHLQCIKLNEQEAKELSVWICSLCKDTFKSYRTKIKNLKTTMKNVKTRVKELRNEVAILKEANNKIPLESPPKQNHKVNANKTTQTTQTSYKDNTAEDNSHNLEEKNSFVSTIVKENFNLKRENKEFNNRITILNRVIEEVLDQQLKAKETP